MSRLNQSVVLRDREVRALSRGLLVQFRRLLKEQPPETWDYEPDWTGLILSDQPWDFDGVKRWRYGAHWGSQPRRDIPFPDCPFGDTGDLLWVRERWGEVGKNVVYAADHSWDKSSVGCSFEEAIEWRPAIAMPRRLSRFTLEVVKVRVERVASVSQEEVFTEGLLGGRIPGREFYSARDEYAYLWDKAYGKQAPWHTNPWTWVVEVKRAR